MEKKIHTVIKKNIYFFSDAHLGLDCDDDKNKEQRIVDFLDSIKNKAKEIYIVGDLFDYWFEYKSVVPKGYFNLFSKFAELSKNDVKIFFIAGNHDYWVKDYFKQFGITISLTPIERTINGKRFYIAHGDGVINGDTGYKILKHILRSKINIFLFSLLHPDIASWIAKSSSKKSRKYTSTKKYESNGMELFANKMIAKGFDYVIMGHNHIPSNKKIGKGNYINLGDWINNNTYAVFDGKKMDIKTWRSN